MRVVKVVNNNVVLALDDRGTDVVLMGRGLGFGIRPGDDLDPSRVTRTFTPTAVQTPERIAALLQEIPADHLRAAEEIVALGRRELGEHVGGHVLLPLADHLSFALRRAETGVTIAYPLEGEVRLLYPREVEVAARAVDLVAELLGVRLPALEAVPMALHFVNAQFDGPDLTRVTEITETFGEVLDLVRTDFGVVLDGESLAAARFVVHLRYLAARQEHGEGLAEVAAPLYETARRTSPREVACAERIADLLARRHGWRVDHAEILYLTLHVGRLRATAGSPA